MEVRRTDVRDPDAFDAWFDVLVRSDLARPGHHGQGWHPDEWRGRAALSDAPTAWHLINFVDGGATVAIAALELSRDDNRETARADFHVDPRRRRRGIGTEALRRLERYVVDLDRKTLIVSAVESSMEVANGPSRRFAPLLGYSIADEMVRREIIWPRPVGELDALSAEWSPSARDYEILDWIGSTPERWIADRAELASLMALEAPHGDVPFEAERWDASRVRSREERTESMGRDLLVAVARHRPSDRIVGFTELTVSRSFSDTAYQWDTLVARDHRGHRLGGLLKIATMRLLEVTDLDVRRILTFNSSSNAAMIRVNDDLGGSVSGAMVLWRRDL